MKEASSPTQIGHIENDTLLALHIFHREMEPKACTWIACIRPYKHVIFVFSNEINTSKVTYINSSIHECIKAFVYYTLPVSNEESKHK